VDRARDETDALVAVLDSCGTIKFTVFAFYGQDGRSDDIFRYSTPSARSVTTKVPAANASGVRHIFRMQLVASRYNIRTVIVRAVPAQRSAYTPMRNDLVSYSGCHHPFAVRSTY
jgi:hypothetical protein